MQTPRSEFEVWHLLRVVANNNPVPPHLTKVVGLIDSALEKGVKSAERAFETRTEVFVMIPPHQN